MYIYIYIYTDYSCMYYYVHKGNVICGLLHPHNLHEYPIKSTLDFRSKHHIPVPNGFDLCNNTCQKYLR